MKKNYSRANTSSYSGATTSEISIPQSFPNTLTKDETENVKSIIKQVNDITDLVLTKDYDKIAELFSTDNPTIKLEYGQVSRNGVATSCLRSIDIKFVYRKKIAEMTNDVKRRNIQPLEKAEFLEKFYTSSIRIDFRTRPDDATPRVCSVSTRWFDAVDELFLTVNDKRMITHALVSRWQREGDKLQAVTTTWQENGDVEDSTVSKEYTLEEFERENAAAVMRTIPRPRIKSRLKVVVSHT